MEKMKKMTSCKKRRTGRLAGHHGYILGCLLLAALSAGCASMYSKADSISPISGRLAELRVSQPAPTWNSVIHAHEVDFLQPVGDDKLLVGTLCKPSDTFSVSHLEFMLLDGKSGKKIWTYPRSSMGGSYQTVIAVNPVVLVQVNYPNKNKYCALDQQTGKLLWEREVKALVSSSMILSQAMIVVVEASGSNLNAFAINLKDGKDVWKQEITKFNPSKSESLNLQTSGDAVIVIGKETLSLSLKKGAILWRKPFPGIYGDGTIFSLQKDGLFLSDGKKLCLLNIKSGGVTWETPAAGGTIRHIAPVDQRVLIFSRVTDGKTSHDIVRALRRVAGTEVWSHPLKETIQSPLLAGANGLYFSSRTRLYSLDFITGNIRFATPIPAPLTREVDLPDVLSEYDQKIILGRENGVAAFSPDKGALLFSEQITGGRSLTYHYIMNRYLEAIQVAAGPKKAPQVLTHAQTAQESGFLRMTQANRDFVYAKTEPIVSSGTGTPPPGKSAALRERISATDQLIFAQQQQMREEKYQAGVALGNAIGESIKSIGTSLGQVEQNTLLTNRNHRLNKSILDHSNSLNYEAGLYVRPFYRDGLNLAMVDLKTGKRADIVLSPNIEPLGFFCINIIKLPAFSFDRTGTKLIVKGLGLQESQYETYEMKGEGCGTGMRNWTIPYPSILLYDLPAILQTAKQNRGEVVQEKAISDKEKAMITAAFKGDEKTVKEMLEQGANVNAMDEDGHTALMHAILALNTDVIELLVKSGADGSIKDDDCWNAEKYLMYLASPSGTGRGVSLSTISKIYRLLIKARKPDKK